jgi:hypothetical protein
MRNEKDPLLVCYIRARRPDGGECTINLMELEDALEGVFPGDSYLLPESGKIIFRMEDGEMEDEVEEVSDDEQMLPIDPLSSHQRFEWMEEFINVVRSVPLQAALRRALRNRKPFRNFKDALLEYPSERQRWFDFEAEKLREAAVQLIEELDWEIVEVVDRRPAKANPVEIDPAERVPLTAEEYEWVLRGGWQIATRGGRTQLALLLKGSKNKALLKHNLQTSPAYGRLSFLTLEEIENRIDQVVRKGDLQVEFFGDLPLIILTRDGWEHVRGWADQYECEQAAAADEKTLLEMLLRWRQRPRREQFDLVDASATLNPEARQRVLKAWRTVAGKEVGARIEARLAGMDSTPSVQQ